MAKFRCKNIECQLVFEHEIKFGGTVPTHCKEWHKVQKGIIGVPSDTPLGKPGKGRPATKGKPRSKYTV